MNKTLLIIFFILIFPVIVYVLLNKNQSVSANKIIYTKPTVIKFYSDICGECRKMNKVLEDVYPVYQKRVNIVSVSVQEKDNYTKELIKKYNIKLVPTLIFIKSENQVSSRLEGSVDVNTLKKHFDRLLNE